MAELPKLPIYLRIGDTGGEELEIGTIESEIDQHGLALRLDMDEARRRIATLLRDAANYMESDEFANELATMKD